MKTLAAIFNFFYWSGMVFFQSPLPWQGVYWAYLMMFVISFIGFVLCAIDDF